MAKFRINTVVAHSKNMVIGKGNELIWKIPNDQKRFRELTTSHPVIMGRKTWESLPEKFRPLPNRTNVVITRDTSYTAPGAQVVSNIDEAVSVAQTFPGNEEIFIIGGAEVYKLGLPVTDRLYLTVVDKEVQGDAFFPEYKEEFKKEISREDHEYEGLKYTYLILER